MSETSHKANDAITDACNGRLISIISIVINIFEHAVNIELSDSVHERKWSF